MLRIIKATEPLTVDRINMCIYSQPGLGKTSFAFTAESPLLLDCDAGAYRASNRKETVPVHCWADIASITPQDMVPFKTIIVDTAGRALDYLTTDIIAANPKMGRGGALTLQGYGELKAKFTAWIKMLRQFGKDVVLIAHMDEQRNGDDVIERLDVQGGSKAEIYKSVDAMGRIYVKGNGERFLDFNPRENSLGKNPCQLPIIPVPMPDANGRYLAEVIVTIKERLNASVEAEKQTVDRLRDWEAVIKEAKTPEELNRLIPQVRSIPQGDKDRSKVVALLNTRGRELKLDFDRKRDLFIALPKRETAVA